MEARYLRCDVNVQQTFCFKYAYFYLWITVALTLIINEVLMCYSVNIPEKNTLYETSDDVTIFDNETFRERVYGSPHAWFVQFYSSWCGHCVHFAPTWKTFAQDIKGWQRIAKLGAVNCADKQNSDVCREYIDVGFPTLRLFKALQKNGTGDISKGPRDVEHLRHALVDHISRHSQDHTPSHWPMLSPVGARWLVNFNGTTLVAVVFEDAESYIGRELILDMSSMKDVLVVRVLREDIASNPLMSKWKVTEIPSLFILKQSGEPSEIWRSGSRESFYAALQTYVQQTFILSGKKGEDSKAGQGLGALSVRKEKGNTGNRKQNDETKLVREQKQEEAKANSVIDSKKAISRSVVYMQDLESTLIYSLKYEVSLQKLISADAMSALKSYIAVLNKYFPGRVDVMNALEELQRLLQPHTYMSHEDWSNILNHVHRSQVRGGGFWENDVRWIGCQGSTSVYRGYPCGLWVLFHTLTVSHTRADHYHPKSDSKEVLRAMKGYIHFFFGCRVCSENFAKESVNLESSVRTSDESVLWLWQIHNRVNKRLAGDISEDPQHPKEQFPSLGDCRACYSLNAPTQWNNSGVLRFLNQLYSVNNINFTTSGVGQRTYMDTAAELTQKNVERMSTYGYFKLGINTADISMCLLLYALCSALLLVICMYLRHRQKRKLFKYFV